MKRKITVDVIALIDEVRKHKCLWVSEYRNRRGSAVGLKAWKSISGNLGYSVYDLRAKWKNLKDAFRKELKKNYFDGEYRGIWQYFEALDFLKDSVAEADKVEEFGSDDEVPEEIQEMIEANSVINRKMDSNVVKLIVEVKKHECIWNKDCHLKGLQRTRATAKAWVEVANKLDRKVDDVRTKWRNMRYIYKREVQKNFSDGEYKGSWQYFNLMTFVKTDYVYNKDFDDPVSCDDSESDKSDKDDVIIKTEVEIADVDNPLEYFDGVDVDDPLPEKRQKVEDDEYDLMFLKSLAPFFRGMDNVRKLALRSRIQDMVMKEITNGNQ